MAEDVRELLDSLGLSSVYIQGASGGFLGCSRGSSAGNLPPPTRLAAMRSACCSSGPPASLSEAPL